MSSLAASVGTIRRRTHSRHALLAAVATVGVSVALAAGAVGADVTELGDSSQAAVDQPAERGDWWSLADTPQNVVFISDSAIAGIRWSGALDRLVNSVWDDRLESCRRLVASSCRGREGYRPPTAYVELQLVRWQRGPAGPDDLLVMAVGYNDWHGTFLSDFQAVMTQARAAGFRRVAWLTYREDNSYTLPRDSMIRVSNYAIMNQVLRSEQASGRWPELTLFEYDAATRGLTSWYASDGIHVTATGAAGVADWLSDQIRYVVTPSLAPYNWIHPADR